MASTAGTESAKKKAPKLADLQVESMSFLCRCVDPAIEFTLDGLDNQSTYGALLSYLEERSTLKGPFEVSYGSPAYPVKGKKSQTLKQLGMADGEVIVFKPVQGGQTLKTVASPAPSAVAPKEEKVKEVPETKENQDDELQQKEALEKKVDENGYSYDFEMDLRAETLEDTVLDEWSEFQIIQPTTKVDPAVTEHGGEEKGDSDAPPGMPSLQRQQSYVVLGKMEINQRQKDILDEVVDELKLSESDAALLLRAFDWKKDALVKAYTDDAETVRSQAGLLPLPDAMEQLKKVRENKEDEAIAAAKEKELFSCPYCADDLPYSQTMALHCGHRFCLECWKSWLMAAFDKGSECVFTSCPEFKCKEVVPSDFFLRNLDDVENRTRYQDWLAAAFVMTNVYVKWCTKPGCDKAVEYTKSGMKTVTCSCGQQFCFGCSNEPHEPAPCSVVKDWIKKNATDAGIFKWVEEESKNAPQEDGIKNCTKCNSLIWKNQGCKHMTCKSCKHEFCWLCLKNWHGHDEGKCGQYQNELKEGGTSGENEENDFKRHQFYFARYENHKNSIKWAERTLAQTKDRMIALQEMDGSDFLLTEVDFLQDAVLMVIKARRLLMWSYAWCYYLADSSSIKLLFKNHMNKVEEFTENLHGMAEQDLETLQEDKRRTEVIHLTRVLGRYCKNIVDFAKSNH